MTDKEKLEALIHRAVKGGFDEDTVDFVWKGEPTFEGYNYPQCLIFSHNFAKALWGRETDSPYCGDIEYRGTPDLLWQYHLQQAVISTNPISYMYSTVFTEPNKN